MDVANQRKRTKRKGTPCVGLRLPEKNGHRREIEKTDERHPCRSPSGHLGRPNLFQTNLSLRSNIPISNPAITIFSGNTKGDSRGAFEICALI
ncbi:MAG: hypothetical protein M1356_01120 [Gammaproteobacteria bacterium]|nr:hypothetical protein [Gammaproteobacteria bacterium]